MNPIDDSDRLVPCPHCGSEAEFHTMPHEDNCNDGAMFVMCTNSACMASSALVFPTMDDVTHVLMERWNRRTAGDVRRHIICLCPDCSSSKGSQNE